MLNRLLSIIAALALLAISSAASAQNLPAAVPSMLRGCAVQYHALGTPVQGDLSVSDCKTNIGMAVPTDVYAFTTSEQRDIMVSIETPGAYGTLTLLSADGEKIAEDGAPDGYGQVRTQVAPGAYYLVVRQEPGGNSSPFTGRYTLTSSTDQIGFAGCVAPLAAFPEKGRVQGTWSVTDCKYIQHVNAMFADYYLIKVDQTREVEASVTTPVGAHELNVFIALRDGTVLGHPEFNESGVTVSQVLEPGEYILALVAPQAHARMVTGPYTLSVR